MNGLTVLRANIQLAYKDYFFNRSIYLSLFLWPLMTFISAYYSFMPFEKNKVFASLGVETYDGVFLFLIIGFISLMFYNTLVQSAWRFGIRMRYNGALELMYMTPANRFMVILGNCISSLAGSIWMLVVFGLGAVIFFRNTVHIHVLGLILALFLQVTLALLWGCFLNSLFLYTRDGSFLYTLLNEPLEVFGGVRVPVEFMPIWGSVIASILPITYTVIGLRKSLLFGEIMSWTEGLMLLSIGVFLFIASVICLHLTETHHMECGGASLF